MLQVKNIHTYYDIAHILFGVSLSIAAGEVICLLGRNGAGKTTIMRSILGLTPPRQGSITFKGQEIVGEKPYMLVRRGMGYVPDDRRIFADLSVEDNLNIAERKQGAWNKQMIYQLFPELGRIRSRRGGNLSGGEQQMLSIARALVGNPELLLLDEPTEGLAPLLVLELKLRIGKLKDEGLTILLAEQNIQFCLEHSDRGYIIENGAVRYHGSINELRDNEAIREKYLLV